MQGKRMKLNLKTLSISGILYPFRIYVLSEARDGTFEYSNEPSGFTQMREIQTIWDKKLLKIN
jgi:hypothetical protein